MMRISEPELAALETVERLYGAMVGLIDRYGIEADVSSIKIEGRLVSAPLPSMSCSTLPTRSSSGPRGGRGMDQLTMFDTVPTASKPPKPSKFATSSTKPGIINPAIVTTDVPTKRADIVNWLRDEMLPIYHQAVVTGDAAGQLNAMAHIDSCHRRYSGTWRDLSKSLSAPEWQVPIWGQPGTMLLIIAGVEVVAEYEGLFGYDGMGTRPANKASPFYSYTGFRHFSWHMPDGSFIATGGLSLPEWLVHMAEADLTAEMARREPS